jgi:hypothetical protein
LTSYNKERQSQVVSYASPPPRKSIFLLFVILGVALGGSGSSTLSLDTTGTSTAIGRSEREVNVLLGVETDNERRDIDDLLANTDVTLTDQDTGVVDGLCKTELEDLGLKATLQEILDLQGQDVIELHLVLVQDTDADQAANQRVTLEEAAGVLVLQGQELTGSTTDVGQREANAPDLTLVAETVLSNELQLLVETGGLEGTTGDFVGF